MNRRDDDKRSADKGKYDELACGQAKGPAKITTAAKMFRTMTAIVFFGIPLVTGTAALIGYGVHSIYKRITGSS